MKNFKNTSIQTKMLIYFFLLIFIPFTMFNIIQFSLNTRDISDTLTENTKQMLRQIDINISSNIDNLSKTSALILNLDPIQSFFTSPINENIETSCRKLLTGIRQEYPEISGIILLRKDDIYISNEMYKTSKDPLIREDWYLKAISSTSPFIISRPIARNLSTHNQYSSDEIISLVMPVYYDQEFKGVIVIDSYLSNIEEIIDNTIVGTEGFTYLVDDKGQVMFTPLNKITYRINSQKLIQSKQNTRIINIDKRAFQVILKQSGIQNWTIIGVFPLNELHHNIYRFKSIQLYTILMASVLGVIFTHLTDRSITKPIKKLQTLMKQAENGDLNVAANFYRGDEIGKLGISFNQMIKRIRSLLTLVEKEHKEKVEAELRVLQAQIKPHFLYNTLDTIRWMAVEHEAKDIEDVVQSLTKLFRIGLNKGQDIISLDLELQHVSSYLKIQHYRYEDELTYKITNELKDLKVLKLILQPLVENAIYHGIKEQDKLGHIRINTAIERDRLIISVSDNGIGLEEEKLKTLNTLLESNDKNTLGYGIFNVNSRLKLSFGSAYGIKLLNQHPGVTVLITHPIIKEATDHETFNS
jgi:two-component system sensor histidine kinase YesM